MSTEPILMKKRSKGPFDGFDRIELVSKQEGVYIYIFRKHDSAFPEEDYLVDDFLLAMEICEEDYRVPLDRWEDVRG